MERDRVSSLAFWIGTIAVAALLILTRLPFYSDHFFDWDATQLGLAIDRFDIAHHQPHPPGYLFYVLLARGLDLFVASPQRTFQILSSLMTGIGIAGTWALARRFCGLRGSVLAVVATLFHPYVWAYGVVGESYAAEFAVSTWIGVLAVDAWRGRALAGLAAAALLGIAGGIRTSIPLFMAPLVAAAFLRGVPSWRVRAVAIGLAILGTVAWFVPTAISAGGATTFLTLTSNLTTGIVARLVSPLIGESMVWATNNITDILAWTAMVPMPLLVASFPLLFVRSSTGVCSRPGPGLPWLCILWVLPAMTFYLAMFASRPGYVLTYFAPLVVAVSALAERGAEALVRRFAGRTNLVVWLLAPVVTVALCLRIFFDIGYLADTAGISAKSIGTAEDMLQMGLDAVAEHEASAGPGTTAFVVIHPAPDWRRLSYYRPDVPIWLLMSKRNFPIGDGVDACRAQDRRFDCASGPGFWTNLELPDRLEVPVDAGTERLVILLPPSMLREMAVKVPPDGGIREKSLRGYEYTVLEFGTGDEIRIDAFTLTRRSRLTEVALQTPTGVTGH